MGGRRLLARRHVLPHAALRHPDLFPTFGDYGGLLGPRTGDDNDVGTTVADLFAGDEEAFQAHDPRTLLSRRRFAGTAGWFEMGAEDTLTRGSARELVPLARAAGVETCFVVVPGFGHVGEVWRRAPPGLAALAGRPHRPHAAAAVRHEQVPEAMR